ncbi:MAG: hypothetical protein ACRCXT_21980 [Paraclostridium sp.]
MKHMLKDSYLLQDTLRIGAVVTKNGSVEKFGVVSLIEDEDITVYFSDDTEEVLSEADLFIMDFTNSLTTLNTHKNTQIFNLWLSILNGKNDDFDVPCLYVGDRVFNKVDFIKYYKMSKRVIDKRFQREMLFHKKIGEYKIYKASTCTINDNNILELDRNSFAYYILNGDNVYFVGVKTDINELINFLYNHK